MSNNLAYWGRRAGAVMKDGTWGIRQSQWGAGASRDGKSDHRRFHWPMRFKDHGGDTQSLLLSHPYLPYWGGTRS